MLLTGTLVSLDLFSFINLDPLPIVWHNSEAHTHLRFSRASVCFQPLEPPSYRINRGVAIMTLCVAMATTNAELAVRHYNALLSRITLHRS